MTDSADHIDGLRFASRVLLACRQGRESQDYSYISQAIAGEQDDSQGFQNALFGLIALANLLLELFAYQVSRSPKEILSSIAQLPTDQGEDQSELDEF
jgi:hypothetical protein